MLLTGQIAQFVVPADGNNAQTNATPDWPHNALYLWGNDGVRKYATTPFATQYQSAIRTIALSGGTLSVDAVGNPLMQTNASGAIYKLDPTTLATTATYGAGGGAYPASLGVQQTIVSVTAGGVPYAAVKEGVVSANAGIIRTDTMTAAGFYANVSPTGNAGGSIMCGGQQGAAGVVFFADWVTLGAVNLPIHKVTIGPTAPAYNIASWPTPNPAIASVLLRTLHATDINPAWTAIYTQNIAYDAVSNTLVLDLTNGGGGSDTFVGIDANSGATLWISPLGSPVAAATASAFLSNSQAPLITGGSVGPPYTASVFGVTTAGGTFSTDTVDGLQLTSKLFSNDHSRFIIAYEEYVNTGTSPTPVVGTAASFTGWAMLDLWPFPPPVPPNGGGGTGTTQLAMDNVICTATTPLLSVNLVSLRWSDDRGHSWGSWVSQPIGEAGEYRTSLQWQRLAYARDRCFEISWSVPMRTALQGCWVDVTPAQS